MIRNKVYAESKEEFRQISQLHKRHSINMAYLKYLEDYKQE